MGSKREENIRCLKVILPAPSRITQSSAPAIAAIGQGVQGDCCRLQALLWKPWCQVEITKKRLSLWYICIQCIRIYIFLCVMCVCECVGTIYVIHVSFIWIDMSYYIIYACTGHVSIGMLETSAGQCERERDRLCNLTRPIVKFVKG